MSSELKYCPDCIQRIIIDMENGDPVGFLIRVIDEEDCTHDLSGD